MSNKTFIPAFKATVGDWEYYICIMKYAEVARQVGFAYELGGNQDLGTMIQRGISARTAEITDYLLANQHRFLGAMIVATWGGDPEYTPLSMEDPDGLLHGLDREFGVLTLDGSHQFFALDGQHRLRAVKDAIKQNPEIGREDIAILLVPHFDTQDGRRRTRRLFTNINRNAKATTVAENIALDEDDGFAIVTRQLLNDHSVLSKPGLVKIFMKAPSGEGELKLAGNQISRSDPTAWTTIVTLYDILRHLSFGLPPAMLNPATRPSDEDLEQAAKKLGDRIDELLKTCGSLDKALTAAQSARDVRAPKNDEGKGHPLMRPVIQKAIARAAQLLIDEQQAMTWKDFLKGLGELDWQIEEAPWNSVFVAGRGTIQAGKDFTDLLLQLILVHLAPTSRQEIKRARKAYRDLKGTMYPVSEDTLASKLKAEE